MGALLSSCRGQLSVDEQEWDAAHHEDLLEAARGDPPLSRALCPLSRQPLHYSPGKPRRGTATCARSGRTVALSKPHFFCPESRAVVSLQEGPSVYIERQYDQFNSITKRGRIQDDKANVEREPWLPDGEESFTPSSGGESIAVRVLSAAGGLAERIRCEAKEVIDEFWEQDGVVWDMFEEADDAEDLATQVMQLASATRDILSKQAMVSEVGVPCKIFGDIHGQLRDVLIFFSTYGWPGSPHGPNFVFNGDFVDRGRHDLEVVCLLFALKVAYPARVWLNRGNHEDASMNVDYGFQAACDRHFGCQVGRRVFQSIQEAFCMLPLASVVGEKILALHGGLGNGNWKLSNVSEVPRPLSPSEIEKSKVIFNILWSDPIEEDDPDMEETFGVHPSDRGGFAVTFGFDVTVNFCRHHGLGLIVRSHQAKEDGFGFDVMHDNMLIRVFSARDYDEHNNHGAILSVRREPHGLLVVRPQLLCRLESGTNFCGG